MGSGSGGVTCDTVAAAAMLYHNPKQADMLASSPAQLAKQAAELLRKAEGCERDPEGRPSGHAVQFALQACLVYLHQAAVLQERHLAVDTRSALHCCCAAVTSEIVHSTQADTLHQ